MHDEIYKIETGRHNCRLLMCLIVELYVVSWFPCLCFLV